MIGSMGGNRCEDVLARLWEFIDGELPHDERDAVRRHLEVCRRGHPQYDFQRACLHLRRVAGKEQASTECRRRLFQALLEQERRRVEGR